MTTITPTAKTPYRSLKGGMQAVAEYTRDHQVAASVAVAGTGAAVAGYLARGAAWTGGRVAAPALGAGIAALGVSAIHDALANDVGRDPGAAVDKLVLGTAATMAGTKIVGSALNIPVAKDILTFPGVYGAGMAVAGVALARSAAIRARQEGLEERHIVVGAVGSAAVPGGFAVAAQSLGHPQVARAAAKGSLVAGAAGLGGLSWFWGHRASESFQTGHQFQGTGYASLSVGAGLGSAWVIGKASGIKALQHADRAVVNAAKAVWDGAVMPAGKLVHQHPVVGGALVAGALGTAAYGYYALRRSGPVPPPIYGTRPLPPTIDGSLPVPPPGQGSYRYGRPDQGFLPPVGVYPLPRAEVLGPVPPAGFEAAGTDTRIVIDVRQR